MTAREICGIIVLVCVLLGIILELISAIFKKHLQIVKLVAILLALDGAVAIISFAIGLFLTKPKL